MSIKQPVKGDEVIYLGDLSEDELRFEMRQVIREIVEEVIRDQADEMRERRREILTAITGRLD